MVALNILKMLLGALNEKFKICHRSPFQKNKYLLTLIKVQISTLQAL